MQTNNTFLDDRLRNPNSDWAMLLNKHNSKLTTIKQEWDQSDPYFSRYTERFLLETVMLDIYNNSGGCTSRYIITIQKINQSIRTEYDFVDMGVFDEPRPVQLDTFGPFDLVDQENRQISAFWPRQDQQTEYMKSFKVSLERKLTQGQICTFRCRVEEPNLFNCDKDLEFWDTDVSLPTEELVMIFVTPPGIVVHEPRVIFKTETEPLSFGGILKSIDVTMRADRRYYIEYILHRPPLGDYDFEWRWNTSGNYNLKTHYLLYNGYSQHEIHDIADIRESDIVINEMTQQVFIKGQVSNEIAPGSMLYQLLHILAEYAKKHETRIQTRELRDILSKKDMDAEVDIPRLMYLLQKKFDVIYPELNLRELIQGVRTGGYIIKGELPIQILKATYSS